MYATRRRRFIDPLYPDLWPTMDKIFAMLNDVFPVHISSPRPHPRVSRPNTRSTWTHRTPPYSRPQPEYPFHMGGDEVDRNEWALCPNAIQWAAAHGQAGNVGNAGACAWWGVAHDRVAGQSHRHTCSCVTYGTAGGGALPLGRRMCGGACRDCSASR